MNRVCRNLALFGGGFVLLSFTVFVINQTAQAVELASTLHPLAGRATLIGLLTGYVVLAGVPIAMMLRLPRPLAPPTTREGEEYQAHLCKLTERLVANRRLKDFGPIVPSNVEKAVKELDRQAEEIVKKTAHRVFLATAISQSGRLDTLLVFSMQTRMVWQIAHLYCQRPSPRDLMRLYVNVAGTAFVAGELDDLELGEQIEPVFTAVLGSLGGAVPGLQLATSILASSILSGAADAFLTLRVGMIARSHCGATVLAEPATIRRQASAEAAKLLGAIVAEGSSKLTGALWRSSRDKATGAAREVYSRLSTVVDKLKRRGPAETAGANA